MLNSFKNLAKLIFNPVKVKKVFFVLSTGRCGTRYMANILNLSENAIVLHEPPPGAEPINPLAYELFVTDREKFNQIRVGDFPILKQHANIYRNIDADIFGDCYNSFYPFAIALYHFFTERGINTQFIHLVRHPFDCCSSILRAEGPHGIGTRKNFGLRAKLMRQSEIPAEIASDVWIKINDVIRHEIEFIERFNPGSTGLARIEDMNEINSIINLYSWLELHIPNIDDIKKAMQDRSDIVRHSHQLRLNKLGIPKVTAEDMDIIKAKTRSCLARYGY